MGNKMRIIFLAFLLATTIALRYDATTSTDDMYTDDTTGSEWCDDCESDWEACEDDCCDWTCDDDMGCDCSEAVEDVDSALISSIEGSIPIPDTTHITWYCMSEDYY